MKIEVLDSDVAKEILTILLYSNYNIQNKIPENIIRDLTYKSADSKLEIKLDKNKRLNEQTISSLALDIFACLYYLYVADDEEKEDIYSNWNNNK